MNIVLIGAGNVATHLGTALKNAGHKILQVYSRTNASSNKLAKKLSAAACTETSMISPKADLYIISLSDHAVKAFIKSFHIKNKVVVHTSGSLPLSILGKIKHRGVIYPVQTFTLSRKINLQQVPFCIEWSSNETKRKIETLVKSISKKTYRLNSNQRKQVHLSAVIVNNFVNHLFTVSEKLLKDAKLPFDIIRPLILETAMKVQEESPAKVQTGPARRGDAEIIEEHLKLLSKNEELQKIYKLLTESIEQHHGIRL